jgi:hypothetical protein
MAGFPDASPVNGDVVVAILSDNGAGLAAQHMSVGALSALSCSVNACYLTAGRHLSFVARQSASYGTATATYSAAISLVHPIDLG